MHLWHPTVVHFAIAFFVAAVVAEGIKLFTGKRFWGLMAKYHILAAAVMSFLAVLTGFIDYQVIFMNETGYRFVKSHSFVGFFVFIVIQLMANYKFLMEKILPEKMKTIYLIIGGLGLGLVFGTSFLGKAAVYSHGAGVTMAMMNYYETEKYLKELYGLDKLEPPTLDDSLRAAEFYPGPDTTSEEGDTLAQHSQPERDADSHSQSTHKSQHPNEENTSNHETPSEHQTSNDHGENHAQPPSSDHDSQHTDEHH